MAPLADALGASRDRNFDEREDALAFEIGQRVVAERSGRRRRQTMDLRSGKHGVIEEVLRGDPRPRYQVRWDDGTVSVYSPANGGLHPDRPHERHVS